MKNSRSSRSPKSSRLQRSSFAHGLMVWLCALGLTVLGSGRATAASANQRKRIAVLEFEGPKAPKIHAAVVKLIKRNHTVVTVDVWNRAADDLGADKATEKNIKKVARKLKIDGVVTATVEKRRDSYVVHLKLKSGNSGELVGHSIDVKTSSPQLSAKAQREIKKQLMPLIDDLERNRDDKATDDDTDENSKPADIGSESETASSQSGKKHHVADRADAEAKDAEAKTTKPKNGDAKQDEAVGGEAAKKSKTRDHDAVDDADERDVKHARTDDTARGDALRPGNRAVDLVLGMSLNVRQLKFQADADLVNAPPSYRQQVPVVGGIIDATVYPMALGHNYRGFLTGLGIEVMYDRVIRIRSQRKYLDAMMNRQVANLATTEDRVSVGAVLRYPVTSSVVIGGKVQYSRQQFDIAQQLPNNAPTDVPSVLYAMYESKLFLNYSPAARVALNLEGGYMLVSSPGAIANGTTGYGSTSASGFELSAGFDINVAKHIFIRVLGRLERISLTFKGDPNSLASTRDGDPMQDVHGATDLYFGGAAMLGFAY